MRKIFIYSFLFSIIGLGLQCKSGPTPEELKQLEQQKQQQILNDFQIKRFDPYPKKIYTLVEHYPSSNEMRIDLFMPHIKDLRGGYIGVGTDQNLSFIAKAKSSFAWLMDLNPVIVGVNKIHILFLKQAKSYSEFKALWSRKNKEKSFSLVKGAFEKNKDWKLLQKSYKVAFRNFSGVPDRLRLLEQMSRRFKLQSFHNLPEEYTYLRNMALAGKIQAINGDLKGTITMNEIAQSAKKIGTTINILYTSNAEEYFLFPKNYRDNILRLPTSEKSTMVRTFTTGAKAFGFPEGELFPDTFPFHYNLQPLENFKKWMLYPTKFNVFGLMRKRSKLVKGLSVQKASPEETGLKKSGDISKYAR
ncbi:MAG: hypothetical protein AAF518_06705 [Spirochaetota bacterium]